MLDLLIQTSLGKGTRFTLDLPLTLAATLAVIIRSDGEVAAVPHESIEHILACAPRTWAPWPAAPRFA